jgi:hypothetical protein
MALDLDRDAIADSVFRLVDLRHGEAQPLELVGNGLGDRMRELVSSQTTK